MVPWAKKYSFDTMVSVSSACVRVLYALSFRCEHVAVRGIKTKNCREWAAEKRNPTSEAHYDQGCLFCR
jgi:hypothetical protein